MRKLVLYVTCGVVGVISGVHASAQTTGTEPANADAPPAAPQSGFQDIVVTARKRNERLQDVPVAISAYTSKDLGRYSTQSIEQVASQTPQLIVGTAAATGGGVINLRGIGSAVSGATIDQAVSINIDGIQISSANALRLGLHDLNRIEILKGPQALFYGKNSPGGIISIISENPSNRLEAKLRGGYEFYNKQKFIEGTISGPITPNLGARVDAYYSNQSGWFRNDARPIAPILIPAFLGGTGELTLPGVGSSESTGPNSKEYFVRGTLAYSSPGGELEGKLKVNYGKEQRRNGLNEANQLVACAGSAPQFVLALGSSGSRDCKLDRYYNEADIPPALAVLNPAFNGGKPYFNNEQFLSSLSLDFHPSDQLTISSVTGYYDLKEAFAGNFSFGDQAYLVSAASTHIKQFTQELRATTKFTGRLNFMVGGFYQRSTFNGLNPVATADPFTKFFTGGFFSGPVVLVNPKLFQKTDAYSLFGQLIYNITSELQLTAGARYSHEKKGASITALPTVFPPPGGYDVVLTPNQASFNNVSPEVTLTYKPVPNLTFYGAYRQGFKSGGFDLNAFAGGFGIANAGNLSFKQEKVRGGELGAKGTLAHRQILIDLSVYDFTYKGLQVSAFDSNTLGYRITNAASAKVKGVDFSIQVKPDQIAGLTLRSAIAYNHARYGSFENSPCYTGQSQAAGCTIATSNASGVAVLLPPTQNLTGRPLVRAPNWSGNVGATYEHEVGGGLTLGFTVDTIYSGTYYSLPEEDPRSIQREAWRYNASVSLRGANDKWELALIGTNLSNVLRSLSGSELAGTGGGTGTPGAFLGDLQGTPSDPRAITLQATIKY